MNSRDPEQTDYEVMLRVRGFMRESKLDFKQWAERMGLPDKVCCYFYSKRKLSLADLATTAEILQCSADELLFGVLLHERRALPQEKQLHARVEALLIAQRMHEGQSSPQGKGKPEQEQTFDPCADYAEVPTMTATLQGLDECCLPDAVHPVQRGVPVRVSQEKAMECTALAGPDGKPLFRLEPHPDADIFKALGIHPIVRKKCYVEKGLFDRNPHAGEQLDAHDDEQLTWKAWPSTLDEPRLSITWGGED